MECRSAIEAAISSNYGDNRLDADEMCIRDRDKDAETDVPAPKPEKKSNIGMILVIFALAGAAGAAYYLSLIHISKKRKTEEWPQVSQTGNLALSRN